MDTKAMFKFSSGLYVVSAKDGDDYGACIINTGLQLNRGGRHALYRALRLQDLHGI